MSLKDTLISQGKARLMGGKTGTSPTGRRGKSGGKRATSTTGSPLGSLSKYLKR
jgi:hypothetical protein